MGASVAVGRIGAIVGAVLLAETASAFGLWSAFASLAGLWSIGAFAAAAWWLRGVEARGMSLEALATPAVLAAVRELRPAAPVTELPDLGHYPQLEAPDRLAAVVEDALGEAC